MTVKYAPVCDQPGCDRRLTVPGRTMWSDPNDYELDALRTYWQHGGGRQMVLPQALAPDLPPLRANGGWRPQPAGRRRLGGRLLDRAHLPGLRRDALIRQTGKETLWACTNSTSPPTC